MNSRIVAIVGRPNVGKSTLFNRLVGRRLAIVEDQPGTTRDRLYAEAEWNGERFVVVDTGGLEVLTSVRPAAQPERTPLAADSEPFVPAMRSQAEMAIQEADVVIMLTDAVEGLTPADHEVADVLRRSSKPVLLAVNKADNEARASDIYEFYALGLGDPIPISALHGIGVGELLDRVVELLPPEELPARPEAVQIAIVGRPNVGKSSLLNAILGEERAIVSEIPGTTRDAIDTYLEWEGQPVVLIDT
ncbi:MAG: ribosome biogenesis GTPase Der, partial [Anaerolineae bacterium]